MYTENLDDYNNERDSKACYLDGRYFNMLLKNYPGLIREPLKISIENSRSNEREKVSFDFQAQPVNKNFYGVLRLLIDTPDEQHCNLLIFDYSTSKIYRFDPFRSKYYEKVNTIIEKAFPDYKVENIAASVENIENPDCNVSGFCTAYALLYAYAFLNGKEFNPDNIRKFITKVENLYGPLPKGGEEIEYGPRRRGRRRGFIAGAAIASN